MRSHRCSIFDLSSKHFIRGYKFSTHCEKEIKKDGEKNYRRSYRCTGKVYKVCSTPDISHKKLEALFDEYIEKIGNLNKVENIIIDGNQDKIKTFDKVDYIKECENKLNTMQKQRKQIMEQYVNTEISFDDYKQLLSISNEKIEKLNNEIKKVNIALSDNKQINIISDEDIITNLKENWRLLNNKEKMMFFQKFIKKVIVRTNKVGNTFIHEITGIEFNND